MSGWVGLISVVLGLLVLLVGAVVVVRSTVQTRTAQLWQQHAEALKTRLADVERESTECRQENGHLLARLEVTERIVGESLGAGPALESLRAELREHRALMTANHQHIRADLQALTAAVRGQA